MSQFNIQGKNIQLKLGSACETSSNNIALSPDFNRGLQIMTPTLEKSKSQSAVQLVPNKFTKAAVVYKGASNYKQQAKLGEGAVGEVFRVVHKQT